MRIEVVVGVVDVGVVVIVMGDGVGSEEKGKEAHGGLTP